MFRIRFVSTQLLLAFGVVQLFGLFVGSLFIAQGIQAVENPSDPANALYFIGGILVSTAVMLLVLHFYKGAMLFKGVEALLMFAASYIFLSLFLGEPLPFVISVGLVALRFAYDPFKQYLLMFSTAVIGALLGASLDVVPVLIFIVLLSGYDFAAVFLTKHMVFMAKRLDERKASFAVGFRQKKQQVMLGTGDFVVPLVFSVSLLHAYGGFAAVASVIGAVVGLGSLLLLMERRKGYYPGLPPIVGGQLLFAAAAFAIMYFVR